MDKDKIKKMFSAKSKLWGWVGATTLVAGVAVGLGFGLNNYSSLSNDFEYQQDYKTQYSVTTSVDRQSSSTDSIYDIASDLQDRLYWLGYTSSSVDVLSNDELSVNYYLDATQNSEVGVFSDLGQEAISSEIINTWISLFYQSNIEFRTLDGQQLFDISTTSGQIEFIQPLTADEQNPDKSTSTRADTTLRPDLSGTTQPIPDPYSVKLLNDNGSRVVYDNGTPSIELSIAPEALNAFKDMEEFFFLNETDFPSYYIWFGYSAFEWLAQTFYGQQFSNSSSLYSFANTNLSTGIESNTPNTTGSSFLVSQETPTLFLPWENSITIGKSLSSDRMKEIDNRISYSTKNYTFVGDTGSFSSPSSSFNSLRIMLIILLALFAIIIFSFTWYFGLLGLINASVVGLIVLGFVGMVSTLGLPLSIGFGFVTAITMILISVMSWKTLKTSQGILYGSTETYFKNLKLILKNSMKFNTIIFLVFALFSIGIAAFGVAGISQMVFVIFLISVMSYIGVTYLTPVLAIRPIEAITTDRSITSYSYVIGYVKSYSKTKKLDLKNIFDESNKAKNYKGIFLSLLAIISIGLIAFGGIYGANGSGLNQYGDYVPAYTYQISSQNRYIDQTTQSQPGSIQGTDPYGQQEMINEVNTDLPFIQNILISNGITYSNIDVTKNQNNKVTETANPDTSTTYDFIFDFAYGITFSSSTELTQADFIVLNAQLGSIGTLSGGSGYGYEVLPTYSAAPIDVLDANTKSAKVVDSTIGNLSASLIYGLLLAWLFIIILALILYGWTGLFVVAGTTFLSTMTTFAFFALVFAPFNLSFFAGIGAVLLISSVMSMLFMQSYKGKKKAGFGTEISIVQALNVNVKPFLWIALGMTLLFMFLAAPLGSAVTSALFVIIFGFFITTIVLIGWMPQTAFRITTFFAKRKVENAIIDERRVNDPETIEEQYVKGLNY